MKMLTKHRDFLKTRVLPMLLVMTLIAATFSVAFTVSDINVFAQSIEDADYRDVSVDKNDADSSKAFWVDATYYDYLSDEELKPDKGWLKPIQAGTDIEGYNEGDDKWEDNWYPFYQFNNFISSHAGSWTYPLYLGNFCNTYDAYNYSNHNGPYTEATKGLTRFDYISNNSNGLKSYNTSIKGLAAKNLDNSGTIQGSGATTKMPYFDDKLLDESPLAEVITSYFPFRQKTDGKVTTYSFDSTGAKDNVFFRWNGTTPTSVGYGQGETYGVKDGLGKFMSGETSGYGIFPFNNTAATSQGRSGNNNLNYGFGIKLDIDFKVPEDGLLPDGMPVKFNYSGDDDLWVYLSEVDGDNSQLILDLGGAHKMAEGSIDFSTMTATAKSTVNAGTTATDKGLYIYDNFNWGSDLRVWAWGPNKDGEWYYPTFDSTTGTYYVSSAAVGSNRTPLSSMTSFKVAKGDWQEQTDKEATLSAHYNHITYLDNLEYVGDAVTPTVSGTEETTKFGFESDGKGGYKTLEPNKVYHLTIFYMERGLIESNCNMSFTMTPAQNNVEITNKVDLTDINPALWDDIKKNESFSFEITDGTTSLTKDLKDGESIEHDNDFDTHSNLTVKQTTNSNLSYTTSWNVVDKADHDKVIYESTDDSKDTDVFELVNGRDHHDTASMQVNYVNTPLSAPLEITKSIKSADGDIVSDVDTFNSTLLGDINGGTEYK
ncbi:MAG: hypothetical protein J1E41_01870, partial [Ruminococcus sp.]|nr:hypothetical protein [Ruminococcus sp.]